MAAHPGAGMESRVNRAMVKASTTTIAVFDSTKFGRHNLSKIVNVTGVHRIITDVKLPKATSDAIRELGIKLTLV